MKLQHEIVTFSTKHPFVIARGGTSEYRLIRVHDHRTTTARKAGARRRRAGSTARRLTPALAALADALRRSWSKATRGRSRRRGRDEPRDPLQRLGEVGDQRRAARPRGQAARRPRVQAVGARPGATRRCRASRSPSPRRRRSCASACQEASRIRCSRSSSAPSATSRSSARCARRRRTRCCASTRTRRGRPK